MSNFYISIFEVLYLCQHPHHRKSFSASIPAEELVEAGILPVSYQVVGLTHSSSSGGYRGRRNNAPPPLRFLPVTPQLSKTSLLIWGLSQYCGACSAHCQESYCGLCTFNPISPPALFKPDVMFETNSEKIHNTFIFEGILNVFLS